MMIEFRELLRRKEQHTADGWAGGDALAKECDAALAADFRAAFPKRRYRAELWKEAPNQAAIIAAHNEKMREYSTTFHAEQRAINEQLSALAATTAPEITDELNLVHTASTYTYHTQGFGAVRYAEGEAKRMAELARSHGLKAEIRDGEETRYPGGLTSQEFYVWVNTTTDGWELVRRKPANLRDVMKQCWKHGTNPRVMYPFLPVGLEEQFGIDYFGNDLTPSQGA